MPIKVYVAEAEGIPEYGTTTTVGKRLVAVKFLLPEASEKEKWVWKRNLHSVSPLQPARSSHCLASSCSSFSTTSPRQTFYNQRGATISVTRETWFSSVRRTKRWTSQRWSSGWFQRPERRRFCSILSLIISQLVIFRNCYNFVKQNPEFVLFYDVFTFFVRKYVEKFDLMIEAST